MTINITSGSSGWGNYVLYGTKEKPRDSEKVQFLEGDIALGDRLSQSNNYQESYYKIVLAFEGKPSDEVIKGAYEDFKKEFFVGFERDEYHIDAVVHKDTDNYHIHARVPKQNLKTDTHLQLYMDKIDRPRKELIQDHISLKYGFNIARETNREVFKEQSHEHINKWREEHNQKPFNFKTKQGQKEAEQQINSYVSDLIKSELITSQDDVKSTLQELGLKVEKFGHDIKKDFYYTTVSNDTGKMRIKGDIYNDKFYEHNREDRTAQIESNRRITAEREPHQERAERVRKELNRANEKRFKTVTKLFKHSRERADREHSKTLEKGKLESFSTNKHNKHSNIGVIDNSNHKSNEFKEATKLHKREKFYSNRQRERVSEIQPKRANLRQEPKSLLLRNRLKERTNARLTREAIKRAEKSRRTQQNFIQKSARERSSNQEAIQRVREERDRLSERVREVARKLSERVREATKNHLNKFTHKFDEAKKRFLGKTDSIDKKNSLSERFKSVDKSIDATTQENKSVSSNLEKQQELQAPVKKRSHSRSMSR